MGADDLHAFDLVGVGDGRHLRSEPWASRREALARVLRKVGGGVVLSEHVDGSHGPAIFEAACEKGLGGHRVEAAG